MLKYFARRLLGMIPMLLLISVLVFFALELTPLDPVSYLISPDAAVSTENLEALREKLGLNDNVVVRYFRWMGNILRGDFGYSIVSGDPIGRIIALKLPATMELALLALLVSTVLGVGLGIIGGHPGKTGLWTTWPGLSACWGYPFRSFSSASALSGCLP